LRARALTVIVAFVVLAFIALQSIAGAEPARNDYANLKFAAQVDIALHDFYTRNFEAAQKEFEAALRVVPDNTLAISFMNAAAAHVGGGLEALTNLEEDAVGKAPKDYLAHVRLGFSYLFAGLLGSDRSLDAREEFNSAVGIDPKAQAAHVGLGIMRENERSANRAKVEFLAAMQTDPNNVLAREYLAGIYQVDLRDPQTGLRYAVAVPNLVPNYADIQFHLASIMDDLNQYDAAISFAKAGLALDPGRVGEAGQYGDTLIAQILLKQKKVADAKKYLEQAVANDADGVFARKLLDKIAKGDYDDKSSGSTTESTR
jgi:Tfp pilus assembly protein PilF